MLKLNQGHTVMVEGKAAGVEWQRFYEGVMGKYVGLGGKLF